MSGWLSERLTLIDLTVCYYATHASRRIGGGGGAVDGEVKRKLVRKENKRKNKRERGLSVLIVGLEGAAGG